MSKLDLSIIITSYNTRDILVSCLKSIIANTVDLDYEIIIVDNNSQDGSVAAVEKLSQKNPQIHLIALPENVGFGKANNIGAREARGEYLLLLNSDTLIFDNAIKESLQKAKAIKNCGVFSCRLLNSDKTVQASGGFFPTLGNVFAWQLFIDDLPIIGSLIPSFHPKQSSYDQNRQMDWVTGAFMVIPKKVFEKAAGFDENIFMYTEEMELCFRLKKMGFQVIYHVSPAIIHLGSASGGSVFALTSEVKNMLYFWQKHKPRWQLPLIKLFFLKGSLLRLLIFGIIKGDNKARQAYAQALKLIL